MVIPFRTLGKTGLTVCPVTCGAWALGGGNDWGDNDDNTALSALSKALDWGVNLIDTAPVYGLGHSEELLGRVIKGRRCDVILATKCGLIREGTWNTHNLTPQSIRKEIEASLRRLQTDYIDLYQLHYPDPQVLLAETLQEMERLREEGKIRFIGVCNFGKEFLAKAAAICEITSVQNQYSLLAPEAGEEVFECCQEKGISFLGYGPLGGGILSGKYKKEPNFRRCDARRYFYKFYKDEGFSVAQETVGRVREVAQKYKVSPAAVAVSWAMAPAAVSSVLCGMRTPQQVQDNLQALTFTLTEEELKFLSDEKHTEN